MRPAFIMTLALLAQGSSAARSSTHLSIDRGLVYRRLGERELVLDVYRPRVAAPTRRPGVVLVHGGSWESGDRWELAPMARDLAERGFVAATIEYRLSGEAQFPAPVSDVRCAMSWLAANSTTFDLDPDRLGLFGPSAGGHLALMAATLRRPRPGLPAVRACAAWFAPTDLLRGMTGGDVVPAESLKRVEQFLGVSWKSDPDRFERASPASHVSRGTPPLFLAHGDRDLVVPYSQAEYLVEAAERHGVDVTLLRVRGAGHGFEEPHATPSAAEVWDRTVAFFEQELGPAVRVVAGNLRVIGPRL